MSEEQLAEMSADVRSFWYLKDCSLFECLSDAELKTISKQVRLDIILRKQYLAYSDPSEESVFFVKKGLLKVLRLLPNNEEVIVDVIGPGEFFGRIVHTPSTQESVTEIAESVDDAVVCVFRRTDFERCLDESPVLQREVIAHLGDRMERIRERVVDLAFRSAAERLAGFLLRYVRSYRAPDTDPLGEDVVVDFPLSQQDVGYLTGMSRQSVTTHMNSWRESDIIDFDRRTLAVRSITTLQRISEGTWDAGQVAS